MVIEIISGLYLGNKIDSCNIKFLISRNIDVVINTTNDVAFLKQIPNIENFRVPMRDDFPESEKEKHNKDYYYQLETLCQFIDSKLKKNMNILIHCRHGKYRSTCLVVAYLMWKTRIKLDEIWEIVRSKYPLVKLKNHLFLEALRLFERDLGL